MPRRVSSPRSSLTSIIRPSCAALIEVIIEDYDHFCGMSGTVVGKNNIFYFRAFVVTLLCALTVDAVLLTLCLNS